MHFAPSLAKKMRKRVPLGSSAIQMLIPTSYFVLPYYALTSVVFEYRGAGNRHMLEGGKLQTPVTSSDGKIPSYNNYKNTVVETAVLAVKKDGIVCRFVFLHERLL